ncbi:helix-turn-helix transcriptional regulator [uncultured Ellagibacter sp.]|uniref:helix-turn-helix domain-containing protein n=1 Tax=uncultured Ellagibacter sp. TaxID=2137580 RepID=UPI00261CDCBB|nr:helix-turn-helix transcriptional regulator [uncultured Ellagibacter sp.]
MASTFPHVTITVASKEDGTDASGELNTLSLGYGFHQAWIYSAMFSAGVFFGTDAPFTMLFDGAYPYSFIVLITSMIFFGIALLALGFTNQMFLRFYVSKRALGLSALLTCLGTYASFFVPIGGPLGTFILLFAGLAAGIGSSLMVVLWGTAFARYEFSTIILNTAVSVAIGIGLYMVLTHLVPPFCSGIITGIFPIAEVFILWRLTPIPYYRRREIPIFHPLTVKPAQFLVRLLIPTAIFGFALGVLRTVASNIVLPAADLTMLLVMGAAACLGMFIIIATIFISKNEGHWDLLFRALLPFIALGAIALPFLGSPGSLLACLALIAGYMCFEALMWIFFADLAQEFRLSPIFVFGTGRGTLALASLFGTVFAMTPVGDIHHMGAGIDYGSAALLVLFALIVGYALSPRQREVKAIVVAPIEGVNVDQGTEKLKKHIAALDERDAAATAAKEPAPVTEEPEQTPQDAEEGRRAKGRFHSQCEAIADRYLLSRRETEVMFLLAKGHNAAFIQDQLCISKSTAKTHINHIYRKLDIHTQQELLSMVEAAKREAYDQENNPQRR